MYAQDFDDRLPPSRQWRTASVDYYRNAFYPDDRQLRCPDAKSPWTYAMNSALSKLGTGSMTHPETTALIFDADSQVPDAYGGRDMFRLRHSGLGTVSFADGHAKLVKPDDPRWTP
ncbi:MAG TPA: hypothetical protein VHE55_10340 [Fimbriimonadaceae bacterium]|nr:hypothetical protein [Fimbriimonadaceae bacterium]